MLACIFVLPGVENNVNSLIGWINGSSIGSHVCSSKGKYDLDSSKGTKLDLTKDSFGSL